MTEQEWLASTDPAAMLKWGMNVGIGREELDQFYVRKLRLFACACCRQVWHLLMDERSRHAVEVSERFADGQSTKKELREARLGAFDALTSSDGSFGSNDFMALHVCDSHIGNIGTHVWNRYVSPSVQANILRDIVGNPRRPVSLVESEPYNDGYYLGERKSWVVNWLAPTVCILARAIYEERAFERVAILGDELEEAGCTNEDVLRHCRGWQRTSIALPGGLLSHECKWWKKEKLTMHAVAGYSTCCWGRSNRGSSSLFGHRRRLEPTRMRP